MNKKDVALVIKETPILFKTPMVEAILSGQKTQTRRIITPQPPEEAVHFTFNKEDGYWFYFTPAAGDLWPCTKDERLTCPYGRPGDQLWVRETWRTSEDEGWIKGYSFLASINEDDGFIEHQPGNKKRDSWWEIAWIKHRSKWRPSIFMPRWVSRIQLRITDIRVEKLQDLRQRDAMAEGSAPEEKIIHGSDVVYCKKAIPKATELKSENYIGGFQKLWDSLNKKRGYSWESNPWVWVIEFMVC